MTQDNNQLFMQLLNKLDKLSVIENNLTHICDRMDCVEKDISEIKSVVTISDLKDAKDNKIEIVKIHERLDNFKKEVKKEIKPTAMVSGLSGTGVAAVVIALVQYFTGHQIK
jgi:hypothetical protein